MTMTDKCIAEDKMLEDARERDHKKKYGVPGAWELFSVNDLT